jgi:hypothetical protein
LMITEALARFCAVMTAKVAEGIEVQRQLRID